MRKLVILDENPKDAPGLSEALTQQGHKMCLGYIEENGKAGETKIYHCTPDMIKAAEIKKAKKDPAGSTASGGDKKSAPKKSAPKKSAPKKAAK